MTAPTNDSDMYLRQSSASEHVPIAENIDYHVIKTTRLDQQLVKEVAYDSYREIVHMSHEVEAHLLTMHEAVIR